MQIFGEQMNYTRIENGGLGAIDHEHNKKKRLKKSTDDHKMSQSIDMFRKYLLTKSQNQNIGKTNKEESEVIKTVKSPSARALIPIMPSSSNFDCNFSRPLSLLEREILPGIRSDEVETCSSSGGEKPAKAQLTIFYAGVINVYDNVPAEKAQAIMLLAGESSLSKPILENEKPKTEAAKPVHPPNLDSSRKLQADLLIARKMSLQHFIEKRRRRIMNNSPYALLPANTGINRDHQEKEIELKLDNNDHHKNISNIENTSTSCISHSISLSLSPFPSRLGYFSPVPSANRGLEMSRLNMINEVVQGRRN